MPTIRATSNTSDAAHSATTANMRENMSWMQQEARDALQFRVQALFNPPCLVCGSSFANAFPASKSDVSIHSPMPRLPSLFFPPLFLFIKNACANTS